MELSWWYKDYGITYYEIGGTTVVRGTWWEIQRFEGLGYQDGKEAAEKWIDRHVEAKSTFGELASFKKGAGI